MDTYRLYSRLWTLSKVHKIKVLMKSSLNTVFKNCTIVTIGTVFSDHCTSKIWIGLSDVVISFFFCNLFQNCSFSDTCKDATLVLPDKKRDETGKFLLNCTVHKNYDCYYIIIIIGHLLEYPYWFAGEHSVP